MHQFNIQRCCWCVRISRLKGMHTLAYSLDNIQQSVALQFISQWGHLSIYNGSITVETAVKVLYVKSCSQNLMKYLKLKLSSRKQTDISEVTEIKMLEWKVQSSENSGLYVVIDFEVGRGLLDPMLSEKSLLASRICRCIAPIYTSELNTFQCFV